MAEAGAACGAGAVPCSLTCSVPRSPAPSAWLGCPRTRTWWTNSRVSPIITPRKSRLRPARKPGRIRREKVRSPANVEALANDQKRGGPVADNTSHARLDVMTLQDRAATWHAARFPACTPEDIALKSMAEQDTIDELMLSVIRAMRGDVVADGPGHAAVTELPGHHRCGEQCGPQLLQVKAPDPRRPFRLLWMFRLDETRQPCRCGHDLRMRPAAHLRAVAGRGEDHAFSAETLSRPGELETRLYLPVLAGEDRPERDEVRVLGHARFPPYRAASM